MGTGELNAGGNPAMDQHPIQGGVEILLVASCYANWDKLQSGGPLGSYADLTKCQYASHKSPIFKVMLLSTVVVLAKHIFETGPGKCSKCLWKSSYIFGYSFVGFLSKRNKMGIWLIYILYIVGRQSRMLLYFL